MSNLRRSFRSLHVVVLLAIFGALAFSICPAFADSSALTNSVAIGSFTVRFPDGWSSMQAGNNTIVVNVTADQQAGLTSAQLLTTPQVLISTEQRTSAADAMQRLNDIAGETSDTVTHLMIAGSPAIQRSHLSSWPIPGGGTPAPGQALTITTAIAAGSLLIRLDGTMPAPASSATANQITGIEDSVTSASGGNSSLSIDLRHDVRLASTRARGLVNAFARGGSKLIARMWQSAEALADDEEDELPPPFSSPGSGASGSATPGSALRILFGGVASEPEIEVSPDGRDVVVAQQRVWTTSNDGGLTFPYFGKFTDSTGGDSSLAYGKSGNFYEATISNSSTAINLSTDSGQTFNFLANAFTCMGASQCGFNGATIPDQEHIAADRVNQVSSKDQVYSAFRNGFLPPQWGIVCSTDSGSTWSTGNIGIAGDFPRPTVGTDGFVYVAYLSGANLMIDKFAQCNGNSGMTPQSGFPKTVASGIAQVTCPVPGLDRCNNGNDLRSPTAVVDDTNPMHLYYSYAVNTGAGNEDIMVQDSKDGGSTWSTAVKLDSGGTARRFMPWICATQGTAYISWYDRRNANGANNDLTDYFSATAFESGGTLTAGSDFLVNASGTSDAQCLAGQTVGSQQSWPGGSRATGDSTSCSEQPELAGVCGTGGCVGPMNTCPSGQTCDSTGICRNGAQQFCDFVSTTCANPGDSCQLWGGGTPKYGDYNGNACAVGHLYNVWASATPTRTNDAIDLFFKVTDTVQPIAMCKAVVVPTDPNLCTASGVSIDNGSTDPDGDSFTLSQSPPNPYPKGVNPVTLTITDQNNQTNSCTANVTVNDLQPPNISCPSPVVECTSPAGATVPLNPPVSDNCPGVGAPSCTPPSGSTFPIGTTSFSCMVADASGNTNSCMSDVMVIDTMPPVIDSIVTTPTTLWPPNHKLVPTSIVVTAHDTCDASPTCQIVSVTSNEPTLGPGSGHTSPDWIITTPGPLPTPANLGVELRAERDGGGTGRIYTINLMCEDKAGNHTPGVTTVTVAHNQ